MAWAAPAPTMLKPAAVITPATPSRNLEICTIVPFVIDTDRLDQSSQPVSAELHNTLRHRTDRRRDVSAAAQLREIAGARPVRELRAHVSEHFFGHGEATQVALGAHGEYAVLQACDGGVHAGDRNDVVG